SVESKELQLGQAGLFTWFAVAAAGGLGLVGLRRAGRAIFPLVVVVGSVAFTVAVIYGTTRFRLPAELALMVPAAVTLDAGVQAARRRWARWQEERRKSGAPEPTTASAGASAAEPTAAPAGTSAA